MAIEIYNLKKDLSQSKIVINRQENAIKQMNSTITELQTRNDRTLAATIQAQDKAMYTVETCESDTSTHTEIISTQTPQPIASIPAPLPVAPLQHQVPRGTTNADSQATHTSALPAPGHTSVISSTTSPTDNSAIPPPSCPRSGPKYVDIFIGNMHPENNELTILEYINRKLGINLQPKMVIELQTKGSNKAFKATVPLNLLNFALDIWDRETKVDYFRHSKPKKST